MLQSIGLVCACADRMRNKQLCAGSAPVNLKATAHTVLGAGQLPVNDATRIFKTSRASPASSPRLGKRVDRISDDAITPRSQRDEYECSSSDAVCIVSDPASSTPEEPCSNNCKQEDCCTRDSTFGGPSNAPVTSPFAGQPRFSNSSDDSTEGRSEKPTNSSLKYPTSAVEQPAPQQAPYPERLLTAQAQVLASIDLSQHWPKCKVLTCKYNKELLAQMELPTHLRTFDVDLEVVDLDEFKAGRVIAINAEADNLMTLSDVEHVRTVLSGQLLSNKKLLIAWEHMESTIAVELRPYGRAGVAAPTSFTAIILLGVVKGLKGMHRAGFVHGNLEKSTVGTSALGVRTIKQAGLAQKLDRSAPMVGGRAFAAPEVS